MNFIKNYGLILLVALAACTGKKQTYRETINLEGEWQFALDTAGAGETQKWYLSGLDDSVQLPGTTDENQKGFRNTGTTTMHLNRVYTYEGPAWYRKEITVPESFSGKHIKLFLERTKSTKVWIDGTFAGGSQLLQSPQQFDVTDFLTPGKHTITILVNNELKLTPYGNVHIYSNDTQTNWNGILGDMYIEASAKTYIDNLQVFPDIENKKIEVEIEIENKLNWNAADVELLVEKISDGKSTWLKPQKTSESLQKKMKLEYRLGDKCSLWDEYEQPLYKLTAIISNGEIKDAKTVAFGMRKFETKGKQFAINGRTTFLRGKHESAVFPLTGYPPMEVDEWVRVFRIAKNYGINHYRFHSYCPPEAAFTAADREGIYLQPELPFWGGLESDSVMHMQRAEGLALLKAYANHPSFVLFSHGNEIWSGHDRVEKNIVALKESDHRPLYTMGCNNNIGYVAPRGCSEFYVGARTPYAHDTILTHTRLTHAFADSRNGGILNTQTPSTEVNFEYAVAQIDIPLVSHEIGQYQIYPDYGEIEKYTGVLRAGNLELFRQRLERSGMLEMDSAFQQASGVWAAICYKAEMEAALRTENMAGFHLLDLQDFPGQGTALVGILDAFMDSKNVITPEAWRQSCNDVVLLLEFSKFCWPNNEKFQAQAVVANYSAESFNQNINWELQKEDGSAIQQGTLRNPEITNGGLTTAGEIIVDLSSVQQPEKLKMVVSLPGTEYTNEYPVWVYPAATAIQTPDGVRVTTKLDKQDVAQLQNGAKVLYFPQTGDISGKSIPGHFPPDFWNFGMFKKISESNNKPVSPGTLGILTNPEHPLFSAFPTGFHTNWQWFSIVKASHSFILDELPDDYYPIVQIIDNLERNHKLGMIFEFKVGEGKLLVCTSQLNQIQDKPEARQLYRSILNYAESEEFNPATELTPEQLTALF